jgi:hypothetical protein
MFLPLGDLIPQFPGPLADHRRNLPMPNWIPSDQCQACSLPSWRRVFTSCRNTRTVAGTNGSGSRMYVVPEVREIFGTGVTASNRFMLRRRDQVPTSSLRSVIELHRQAQTRHRPCRFPARQDQERPVPCSSQCAVGRKNGDVSLRQCQPQPQSSRSP